VRNLTIKLYHIYVCYTNITLYYVIRDITWYSFRYYKGFHITAVGFGTYYPWIRGSACILYRVCYFDLLCYNIYKRTSKASFP